jgi:hypothetical protein
VGQNTLLLTTTTPTALRCTPVRCSRSLQDEQEIQQQQQQQQEKKEIS